MSEASQFAVFRRKHHRLPVLAHLPVCRFRASAAAALLAGVIGALAVHGQALVPDWTLSKTANPPTYTAADQTVTYTYVVTNNTGQDGTLDSIDDDKVATVDCPTFDMPANGSITCTGQYTTTAADVAAGKVVNNATAHGDSCNDDCFVDPTAQATITLTPRAVPTLSVYGLVFTTIALMVYGVLGVRRQSP